MMYGAAERRTVTAAEIECCIRSALLGEVYTTPKPGLVDCHDNGAHKDMDVKLFEISADAIAPYITKMFFTGYVWNRTPKELFIEIRKSGVRAERAMFQATGGVNTHKGMIFTQLVIGLAFTGIYFIVFRYLIIKFDIATTGREENTDAVKLYTKKDYKEKERK